MTVVLADGRLFLIEIARKPVKTHCFELTEITPCAIINRKRIYPLNWSCEAEKESLSMIV